MVTETYSAVFKKVKETTDGNGKLWHVEAIHVTTTRNNRVYSEEELRLAARSLSKRPINYNHDESRWLSYDFANPFSGSSNSTVFMDYDPIKRAVVGDLWVTDAEANEGIASGRIKTVSIEQTPTKGESCSLASVIRTCEQKGVVFDAIGILETYKGVEPGDVNALITPKTEAADDEEPAKKDDDGGDDDKECPDGKHKDADGKCVPDEDDDKDKEEGCGCALSKALGKELYAELKRAEHFARTGELI